MITLILYMTHIHTYTSMHVTAWSHIHTIELCIYSKPQQSGGGNSFILVRQIS